MAPKSGKEVAVGDKVKLATGQVVTITHIDRRMIPAATLIEWFAGGVGNWAYIEEGQTVEVVEECV